MADILAVRDEYRAQYWEMVVQECVASGLRNREFCRQRGIAEKSFYYWQRKLREQIVESASPQLVPLEALAAPEEQLCIQYRSAQLKSVSMTSTPAAPLPRWLHLRRCGSQFSLRRSELSRHCATVCAQCASFACSFVYL